MISENSFIGKNVIIKENVIIEENVIVGDNCYLDYGCILRSGVTLGTNSYVGANCVLGELQMDFHLNRSSPPVHKLTIGENAIIRSHSVLYGGSNIGDSFQTGHHVTVRENAKIGHHVRIGTLTDIQGDCQIGDHVNLHSNVHVGKGTKIGNYVWIFPYCVFTNDPIPPSELESGCEVKDYAIVATHSTLLPGVVVGENSLVGAGSVVTRNVPDEIIILGVPAKIKGNISQISHPSTGKPAYPWQYRFDKYMPWQEIGFEAWKDSAFKNKG